MQISDFRCKRFNNLDLLRILAVAAVCWSLYTRAYAADAKPRLAPDKLKEVNKLLSQYRAAGPDLAKKQELCQQVLSVGPAAAPLILTAVEKDIQPQLRQYIGKFQQKGAGLAKYRLSKIDLRKVAELRSTVLDLQNQGAAFTHELITAKADPAMAQLREMFVVQRSDVLDKFPELSADRKKLETLGGLWNQCQVQVGASANTKVQAKTPSFEEILGDEEDHAASMAMPMDPRTQSILTANAQLAKQLDPEEARTIAACNLTRSLLGLSALAIDLRLCEAARDHSHDMETKKFFSHESPVEGKKTPWDRAKRMGTSAGAENIFAGITDGNKANEGWFHSPGHHKNMLGKSSRIGVGRSGTYFTEMFGS
jgi:uncharacterized protein YkwD